MKSLLVKVLVTTVLVGGTGVVAGGAASAGVREVLGTGTGGSQFAAISAALEDARAQCRPTTYLEASWDSYLIAGNTRWAAWTQGYCR